MYLPKQPFFDLALGMGSSHFHKTAQNEKYTQSMGIGRQRLIIVGAFFCIFFLLIALRLIEIMGLSPSIEGKLKVVDNTKNLSMKRSNILDRNGVLLATNLKTESLYALPHQIKNPEGAAQKIVELLPHLEFQDVLKKLKSNKKFIWIARNLSPYDQARIHRLGIPGLNFYREEKRVYPHGSLLSHVIGFTDVDNKGIGGVEHQFNEFLVTSKESLQLSIDLRIQHILHDEISKGIEQFQAQGGTGIVLDIKTGEVLAMVSFPDFDPNFPKKVPSENLFNRSTLGVYEMGSAFKLLSVAMALENKTATLQSQYDASQPLKVARFRIKDFKPKNRVLSVIEMVQYSSNIACAKMALEVGVKRQKMFLEKLGLLKPPKIELPEVGKPMIPQDWKDINLITISYGYGVSVSPIALAGALAALINGGILKEPTLFKVDPAKKRGVRVVSAETSMAMKKLLRLTLTHGTAKKANVPGLMVGGKTSTAEVLLANRKGYNREQNLSTFVGAFPMTDPQFLVMVMIDRPIATKETYGYSTGGWTSAPIAGEVMKRMAALLGIVPINEKDPKIQSAFYLPGSHNEVKTVSQKPQGFRNAVY
ncbi:MAG: penicillin-binding protein 2 [Proteobacteria bacterium]|nr:penicillin-binding protein 2 [Pseudomonadota bacterium]